MTDMILDAVEVALLAVVAWRVCRPWPQPVAEAPAVPEPEPVSAPAEPVAAEPAFAAPVMAPAPSVAAPAVRTGLVEVLRDVRGVWKHHAWVREGSRKRQEYYDKPGFAIRAEFSEQIDPGVQ